MDGNGEAGESGLAGAAGEALTAMVRHPGFPQRAAPGWKPRGGNELEEAWPLFISNFVFLKLL